MTINPRDYNDHFSFSRDYACVSFLSKGKMLQTGLDLDAEALRKFTKSEDLCLTTNRRLVSETGSRTRFEPYIHTARRKISKLLGVFSTEKIRDHCGWGPGASTDLRRKEAQLDRKMCELPIPVTRSCLEYFKAELEGDLHWSSSILGVVPEGSFSLLYDNFVIDEDCRIETVPKNAKTNRVIAIENRGNSFLQKGVGGFIRKRLRRVGVDLDNQEVNQHWALRAYEDKLATLDLKAASDTISIEAVWLLLPYEWAEFLNSIRSRYAVLPDGARVRLEKFSSMGNGFTFELESMIFWALAQTVSEFNSGRLVSIYGDDIICSQEDSHELVSLLNHVGFEVNEEKSFSDGCFFESCGKHFFQGRECTPAYQKDDITSDLTAMRCANRLLRLGYRLCNGMALDGVVRGSFEYLFRRRTIHVYIPFSLAGDDGWCIPLRYFPVFIPYRNSNWVGSYRCPVLKPRVKQFPAHEPSLLAWSFRRGVVTEVPYLGDITTSDDDIPVVGYRQVCPDRKFELDWD
jgi:hypothetical protein